MAKYETDLVECRQIAEKGPGAGSSAAVGAVGGDAVGQVLVRTTGRATHTNEAGRGAAVLGAAGGAGGVTRSSTSAYSSGSTGRARWPAAHMT